MHRLGLRTLLGLLLGVAVGVMVAGDGSRAESVAIGPLEVERWYQGSSSLERGDVTLLVFWELWCPYCREAMPGVDKQYRSWRSAGLNVIGITKASRGVKDGDIRKYLNDAGITFPVAKDKDGTMSQRCGATSIPVAIAVKENQVFWRGHPMRLTDELLEKWL